MNKKDYYEILGVSKTASQDEIKSAFRKLAKNIIRMFQKKKMLLKNLKKPKKHMQFYLMKKNVENMINLDIVHLQMLKVALVVLMALILVVCQIYLMTS